MSSNVHRRDVMSGKAWLCWTFLFSFVLDHGVCGESCMPQDFKSHITKYLLNDHWFEIRNFTPPGEVAQDRHTHLSIVNMLCMARSKNENYSEECLAKIHRNLKLIYNVMLHKFFQSSNITHGCEQYTCSYWYSTEYISPDQFEQMYDATCKHWNISSLPDCPEAPSLHQSTTWSQMSEQTSEYTTPLWTSSSSSQVSPTTSPWPVHNYSSSPFSTAQHKNTTLHPSTTHSPIPQLNHSSPTWNLTSPSSQVRHTTPLMPVLTSTDATVSTDSAKLSCRQQGFGHDLQTGTNMTIVAIMITSLLMNVIMVGVVVQRYYKQRQQRRCKGDFVLVGSSHCVSVMEMEPRQTENALWSNQ